MHCLEINYETKSLDSMFSSKKSATARASEDFMPNEPTFQTLHIATVSFNSLLLGEVVVPDWDMFHVRRILCYKTTFFKKQHVIFVLLTKILP